MSLEDVKMCGENVLVSVLANSSTDFFVPNLYTSYIYIESILSEFENYFFA
jgi:hypothetical protein